jgi:hypothetical protein
VPRWVIWAAAVVLALVVSGTAIALLDPDGVQNIGENLRGLFLFEGEVAPPALEPTATPSPGSTTTTPPPTATPSPEPPPPTATPEPTPTAPPPLAPNINGAQPD